MLQQAQVTPRPIPSQEGETAALNLSHLHVGQALTDRDLDEAINRALIAAAKAQANITRSRTARNKAVKQLTHAKSELRRATASLNSLLTMKEKRK